MNRSILVVLVLAIALLTCSTTVAQICPFLGSLEVQPPSLFIPVTQTRQIAVISTFNGQQTDVTNNPSLLFTTDNQIVSIPLGNGVFSGGSVGNTTGRVRWNDPNCGPVSFPIEVGLDCNGNNIADAFDIASGGSEDCNMNSVPDECDLASGFSQDCNATLTPDECDISSGTSDDCNSNTAPDECDISMGTSPDCNGNQRPDECDIAIGTSTDNNNDGLLDECTPFNDFDDDGQITLYDYFFFKQCARGPNESPTFAECMCFDSDLDGDVDLIDFLQFQQDFTGELVPGVSTQQVDVTLSGTQLERALQTGTQASLSIEVVDTNQPVQFLIGQESNSASVCFRRGDLGSDAPCSSVLPVISSGGPSNTVDVILQGVAPSAQPLDLLLTIEANEQLLETVSMTIVEVDIESAPGVLVNDIPSANEIVISTTPPTADFFFFLRAFRRPHVPGEVSAASEGSGLLISEMESFNSFLLLNQDGEEEFKTITGADGTAAYILVGGSTGPGTIALTTRQDEDPADIKDDDVTDVPVGTFCQDCCIACLMCIDGQDGAAFGSVHPYAGEKVLIRADLSIPGRGIHYEFSRTYRSQDTHLAYLNIFGSEPADFGEGWAFNYGYDRLFQDGENIVVFRDSCRTDVFVPTGEPNQWSAPMEFYEQLRKLDDDRFELRRSDGLVKIYASLNDTQIGGRLIRMEDRNGNFMTFHYEQLAPFVKYVLTTVVDTMGRNIEYEYHAADDPNEGRRGRLSLVRDFYQDDGGTGRVVQFGYDDEGNLVSVTSPAVTGTPAGNDFPNGKTHRYGYITEAQIPPDVIGYNRARLLHNLTSITRPNEVAAASAAGDSGPAAAGGGTPREVLVYGMDPNDPATFDKVVDYTIGGTNASGVEAGGTIHYDYTVVNPFAASVNEAYMQTLVTDRRGNETEYLFSPHETLLRKSEFTRGFRNLEPSAYVNEHTYNNDKERVSSSMPLGNVATSAFDQLASSRFQHGNNGLSVQFPDSNRPSDQASLASAKTYEPIYQRLASSTDPRGLDPTFVPPNADACGRTQQERYTTRYFFDYQEGSQDQVLPLLAAELATTEQEVLVLLDAAGIQLDLGDLNGDGETPVRTAGNVILEVMPSVSLLASSNQAQIEGDTCQNIEWRIHYNEFGQRIREVDPEANVHESFYFPENDPDGDGTLSVNPADGRALSTVAGGYLAETRRDTTSDPNRNNKTDPPPTNIRNLFRYDDVGNQTDFIDGRNIRMVYRVNQLDQVVQTVSAAEVPGAMQPEPQPNEPLQLIPFAYIQNTYYDFNDNVVRREVEDRGDTANTGGFVDFTMTYDILDQLIERTSEVDVTKTLIHRYRYDANGNPVLNIYPEGNAQVHTYDERDLLFQSTRGARFAPANPAFAALSAPAGPYDRPGVPASTPSIVTFNYDENKNRIEVVDAADTDDSAGNNSVIAGVGDASTSEFDGFDRLLRSINAVGSSSSRYYDPIGKVVKIVREGTIGGPSPTDNSGSSNVELAISETSYDEFSRAYQFDRHLFVPDGVATQRPPEIEDGSLTLGDGRVTSRREFDRKSRVTFTVQDDGDTYRTDFDGTDRRIKEFDPEGNIVESAYDDNNNVIEIRETDVSQVLGVADEVFLTTFFHDALDRREQAVSNIGQRTISRYDSRSNLVAIADAKSASVTATLSRRVFSNDAVAVNEPGNVTLQIYDGISRKTRSDRILTADGFGNGEIGADIFGIKTGGLAPDANQGTGDGLITVLRAWDDNSLPKSVTDDISNRTDYLRDNQDRTVAVTRGTSDPASGLGTSADGCDVDNCEPTIESYLYDPESNVVERIDENGTIVMCGFDGINRPLECDIDRAAGVVGTTRTTRMWDGLSRMISATDNNEPADPDDDSIITYAHDSLSRIIEETQQIGSQTAKAISSAWLAENLRTVCTYPNGRRVASTFDGLDRLDTIADEGAPQVIADYNYIGKGRVAERHYPINGTRMTFLDDASTADAGYDAMRRPVRLRHLRSDDSLIVGFTHRYDRMNNKISEEKLHDPGNSELYEYDAAYRLVDFQRGVLSASQDSIIMPSPKSLQRQEWSLDGVGNWQDTTTTRDGIPDTEARTHTSFNEIAAINGEPRDHDDNGNIVDEDGFALDPDALTLVWDYANRLRSVSRNGALVATYSYHADGRRNQKFVINSPLAPSTTRYYYDSVKVLEERDQIDALTRQYVYGMYVDEPLALQTASSDSRSDADTAKTQLFYHQNSLFSVFAITGFDGAIAQQYEYDVYGEVEMLSTPGNPSSEIDLNPYRFTGRRLDFETGLLYYRARYHDPRVGRFLSRDAVPSVNLYEYVASRPSALLDPSGMHVNWSAKAWQKIFKWARRPRVDSLWNAKSEELREPVPPYPAAPGAENSPWVHAEIAVVYGPDDEQPDPTETAIDDKTDTRFIAMVGVTRTHEKPGAETKWKHKTEMKFRNRKYAPAGYCIECKEYKWTPEVTAVSESELGGASNTLVTLFGLAGTLDPKIATAAAVTEKAFDLMGHASKDNVKTVYPTFKIRVCADGTKIINIYNGFDGRKDMPIGNVSLNPWLYYWIGETGGK